MNGDALGSITEWERAYQFAIDRDVRLVIRGDPAVGQTGSYPIFAIEQDRITIPRGGPRMEAIMARLPRRLFAQAA
jgi:hypothetical protein